MGARGELFTTQIVLENRSYFFNVKENRTGDVFLQIVESKNKNGEAFDRHQIAVFAEDMQKYLQGFESALSFIQKHEKEKQKLDAQKKQAKKAVYRSKAKEADTPKASGARVDSAQVKRTGRVHVVSKRKKDD
ncbi:DUF3276 family protein [Treponema sp. OMZ 840]|uniref:DUF3276 family protein n=1 Tax=Treponema sp. OMZ 840 TaxID=244313 RepID=UPI003D934A88